MKKKWIFWADFLEFVQFAKSWIHVSKSVTKFKKNTQKNLLFIADRIVVSADVHAAMWSVPELVHVYGEVFVGGAQVIEVKEEVHARILCLVTTQQVNASMSGPGVWFITLTIIRAMNSCYNWPMLWKENMGYVGVSKI